MMTGKFPEYNKGKLSVIMVIAVPNVIGCVCAKQAFHHKGKYIYFTARGEYSFSLT